MIDLIRYTSLKWPSSCCGLFIDILAMHSVLLSTTKMSSSIVSYLLTIFSLKHRKWDMTCHSWRMICTVFSLFSLLLHDCMFYEYERGLSFTVIISKFSIMYDRQFRNLKTGGGTRMCQNMMGWGVEVVTTICMKYMK